jgi:hypothetical protein
MGVSVGEAVRVTSDARRPAEKEVEKVRAVALTPPLCL